MGNCMGILRERCVVNGLKQQTNELPIYKLTGKFDCKVVDVYDGDTCTIVLHNKGEYEKHKLRMFGYDSPEIRPKKDIADRDEVIRNAHLAKDALKKLVMDKICIFESMGYDKYGRLLGVLNIDNVNVNEKMLADGYGYAYTGGTKQV